MSSGREDENCSELSEDSLYFLPITSTDAAL